MSKKKNQPRKNKSETSRKQRKTAATRKTASRKMGAAAKVQAEAKAGTAKTSSKPQPHHTSAGTNRSEGIRLFALAGRPTRDQFIRVYGPAGPKMTWQQRAGAGIPAEKFQAALASAGQGKK
jgi:hypothetical protein